MIRAQPVGSVPTLSEVIKSRRRLDRRRRQVGRVLVAMQAGAALHLHYEQGRPIWRLSSGQFVPADVAAVVIAKEVIVAVGDSLFANAPGQTWRYAAQPDNRNPAHQRRSHND